MISRLCPQGPFVLMDKFIEHMKELKLPDAPPQSAMVNGDMDPGTAFSVDMATGRKRKAMAGDESDEEDSNLIPPAHDIYRARQQKKVK